VGAWGAGPFENDDAMDFLADLSEIDADQRGAKLVAALRLPPEGYLELPEASAAIAAAGLIAIAAGSYAGDLDEAYSELPHAEGLRDDVRLRDLALAALSRVNAADREWQELWAESSSADEAATALAQLRSALLFA
jgi:hypothetical protein